MAHFRTGIRETFNVRTVIMILCAFLGFVVARLLQDHALGRVRALARFPELSDVIVMIVAGGFIKGVYGTATVIGAGISLLNNIGARFGIHWLRVAPR